MKRQRGRNRRSGGGGNNPNRHYESNGPDVKIRGSAQQVLEKYLQYARDAQTSGDRVMSEAYFQHAEHYQRLLSAMQSSKDKARRDRNDRDDDNDDNSDASNEEADASTDSDQENGAQVEEASRSRGGRSRKGSSGEETRAEGEAEASGDPLKVIDAEEGDSTADEVSEEVAPKPRRRRTYKKREAASSDEPASGDDDGVLKTLSRGRPKAEPQPEATETSEPAAE